MKASIINKKWILTSTLVFVLAGQYAYQSSSIEIPKAHAFSQKNSGEYVLASTDDRQPAQVAKPADTRPGRPPLKDPKKTEGGTTAPGTCEGCKETPAPPTAEEFAQLLAEIDLLKKENAEAKKEKEESKDTKEEKELTEIEEKCGTVADDEGKTSKQKASAKRRRAACIKKETQKEDLKERREDFKLDIADVKADCTDIDGKEDLMCMTEGFKDTLAEYTGEKAVPASDIQMAYNGLIAPGLKKALYSSNPDDVDKATAVLESLSLLEDKAEYKSLKQSLMNSVKTQAQAATLKVNNSYATAKTLLDQKDPQAVAAFQTAQFEQQKLIGLSQAYSNSIYTSLNTVNDQTSLDYYKNSYVGDVNKILAGINPAGTATTQPTTTTGGTTTTTPGRDGGRTNETTLPQPNGGTTVDNKMTRDNWSIPTSNGQVQFGTPTPTQRGGRGSQPIKPINQ